jgi:hypothetical protein
VYLTPHAPTLLPEPAMWVDEVLVALGAAAFCVSMLEDGSGSKDGPTGARSKCWEAWAKTASRAKAARDLKATMFARIIIGNERTG